MKIPVSLQREAVRRICEYGQNNRTIAQALGISHNTVRVIRDQLQTTGTSWSELSSLDNSTFQNRLGTAPGAIGSRKPQPDWSHIRWELETREVSLELLWQEFRGRSPTGISYPQMTRLFRSWLKKQRLSMRQIYRAGEKLLVDFCGRTVPITDRDTGEVFKAQVFVAVLGASGYIFAWAVPSQQVADWLACHAEAFRHFDGVPKQIISDNLKSAVIKHTKDYVVINTAYAECAEHYGFLVLPARPRKPRDKGLAEVSVQIVQRGILAPLRHRKFFSVEELNHAITPLLEAINNKTSHKFPLSRKERFLVIDAPVLQSLPSQNYTIGNWKFNVRVSEQYRVEWERHFYSVPSQYAHQLVDLRTTDTTIEVMFQRQRIASHKLSREFGGQTYDLAHFPANHLRQMESDPEHLVAWAETVGPNTSEFVRRNLTVRRDFANGLKTVQQIWRWNREEQNPSRLESACGYAVEIHALTFSRLMSIIRNNSDLRTKKESTPSAVVEHANLRGPSYFAETGVETC